MIFQLRDTITARLVLQTDSQEHIRRLLASRNPDLYEVFGLEPHTLRIRWVTGGRPFLTGISKTARPEA